MNRPITPTESIELGIGPVEIPHPVQISTEEITSHTLSSKIYCIGIPILSGLGFVIAGSYALAAITQTTNRPGEIAGASVVIISGLVLYIFGVVNWRRY